MFVDKTELKPCIVALAGHSFSGKTTLGGELSRVTNLRYFDVDAARLQLFPQKPLFKDFRNTMSMTAAYAWNHYLASEHLITGEPIAVGATYSHSSYTSMLRDLSRLSKAPLTIFALNISEEALEERVKRRMEEGSLSVVTSLEHVLDLRRRFVPLEGDDVVQIDTSLPLEQNVA